MTLRYIVQHQYPDSLRVADFPSTHLTFAMATRPDFPLLQPINVVIIERGQQPGLAVGTRLCGEFRPLHSN